MLRKKGEGIIVSCQAHTNEPLHGPHFMGQMAIAAEQGGAIGIRACGISDIAYIKQCVDIPVIGILKKHYENFKPVITPTLDDALAVAYAGADIIAIDCTTNDRPDGRGLKETIARIKSKTDCKVMADIATLEEGKYAFACGADYIATTLFGFTKETKGYKAPGFSLMKQLVANIPIPIIAEGGIAYPSQAKQAFEIGVSWVVVGTAITRPQNITESFVNSVY